MSRESPPTEQIEPPAAVRATVRIAADETAEEIQESMPSGTTEIGTAVCSVRHGETIGRTVPISLVSCKERL